MLNLANQPNLKNSSIRSLSAKASHASPSSSKPGNIQLSSLPSGLVLACIESDTPLARVAVVVRAGARYEPPNQLGLTHTLRSAVGLGTQNFTSFGISQNIQYFGSNLTVTSTRDTISYLLESHNDEDILARNICILANIVERPSFKHWELADNIPRLKVDLSIFEDTPYIQLAEVLNSVAFKGKCIQK